ncbi:hypothetical protein ACLB2K_067136 [Fragaria x ananassa]
MSNKIFTGDELFNPQSDHLLIPVAPASNLRVEKSVAVSGIAKSKVHAPGSSRFSGDRSRASPTDRPVEVNRYDPRVDTNSSGRVLEEAGICPALVGGPVGSTHKHCTREALHRETGIARERYVIEILSNT